jgi:hypothetical protein
MRLVLQRNILRCCALPIRVGCRLWLTQPMSIFVLYFYPRFHPVIFLEVIFEQFADEMTRMAVLTQT